MECRESRLLTVTRRGLLLGGASFAAWAYYRALRAPLAAATRASSW